MRAVALLQDEGHPFHVITVLTGRSLDDPDRLYDFYVRNGIADVGFNIDEIEGRNGAFRRRKRDTGNSSPASWNASSRTPASSPCANSRMRSAS